jgi:hypothetical protein
MTSLLIKDFEIMIEEQRIIGLSPQGSEFANFEKWSQEFPEYRQTIMRWVQQTLNFLDRSKVRELAKEALVRNKLDEAFLIVMVWGYSGDARGPARARRIIEEPNFEQSLQTCIEHLKKNRVREAYESLVTSGPKNLSTSFATKMLFFFCEADSRPFPLIYDRRIFQILSQMELAVSKTPVLTGKQYLDYLELTASLAEKYQLSLEQVEEHLFIFSGLVAGNYSWKRPVDFETLQMESRDKLALLMSETFASFLDNSELLRNGNGGGQYGGYVVTGTFHGVDYELHTTTRQNVNIVKPEFTRYQWNLILLRGIPQTVRDLLSVDT